MNKKVTAFDELGAYLFHVLGRVAAEYGDVVERLAEDAEKIEGQASVAIRAPVVDGPLKGRVVQVKVEIDPETDSENSNKVDQEKMKELLNLAKERGYV